MFAESLVVTIIGIFIPPMVVESPRVRFEGRHVSKYRGQHLFYGRCFVPVSFLYVLKNTLHAARTILNPT